jgi:signal transduction histidine kinase/DNA-binding response OmpR family regulator
MTATVLLLVAAVVFSVLREGEYRQQALDEARVQAEILAAAVAAALAFDDPAAAENYVLALAANPAVTAAAVYDAEGRRFASFLREDEPALPARVEAGRVSWSESSLAVVVPVVQQRTRLGSVYLRARFETFLERLTHYGGRLLLGLMALVLLAVLLAAQTMINRANTELARRARELEEANRRLREQIAEREKAEEALRQAQKMESIGQLTGGVAHDFNNLLAIILGNLERGERRLEEGGDREQVRRALGRAREGAARAATLTRSLLAFSRRQPLRPQPTDVNRLVSGMSELLLRTLGEQITVETVVAGGLWRTSVDPNQLENAILNLALNARDAMRDGGKLTIETANAHLDDRYADGYDGLEPGQYVLLCVSDTGAGMSPEVIEHAFEPFFTTKDVGHGTGLGLSQVYGLVKQSGGHIKIYSEPGQGTTIKIYLPRLTAGEEAAAAAEPAGPAPAAIPVAAQATVLVVEDDDGMREHSAAALAELGHRVLEARDGAEALRALAAHPEVTLLFTDVGLPGGMNGRQVADEARRRRPDLAVLYTTGYARNAIVHDGRLDPGVELVTKPYTFAELARAVDRALRPERPPVLVVEDEPLVRLDAAELLVEIGCEPIEAASLAEALALLRARAGRVAAALVDLGLPDSRGDGVITALRADWPQLPLIVASGAGAGALGRHLEDDPRLGFLPKPYARPGLESALRRAGVRLGEPSLAG